MDFIAEYVKYHDYYEIPRNYVYWSALGLLGATMHRRVCFLHGDIEVHGNLYIIMVGPQGNGKTTPCDFASRAFRAACPNLEIGASTQSAEDIVTTMSKPDFARKFDNAEGEPIEVRPYAFFINEFKDFIAYAPTRMLNFLTNIYDRKSFKASTVKRGLEDIINPSLNILACENPEQLTALMKNSVMSGGASRRFIIVNETAYEEPRAIIRIPQTICKPWEGILLQRLKDMQKVVGNFQWTPEAEKFYVPWYEKKQRSLPNIPNPMMRGFESTCHIQLFKICMLLDSVSDKPMLVFTPDLFQHGLYFLDALRVNMPKLSMAAGRNEMAVSYGKAIEILEANDGMFPDKLLRRQLESELSPSEIFSALRHMEDTDQVYKIQVKIKNADGVAVEKWMMILPARYAKGVKDGEFKEVK